MVVSPTEADVAADFEESLQHLVMNNKYEISNLTVIAKENSEYAMQISRVLEAHIKKTAPNRKLPALYVLDSIVKNVGSPYTIYFGRNLYSTFIDAYTLVDGQTRKSMEGMLKTWQEPVLGSMDNRPVFSVEVTRSIQNALIKARTAFHQQQQQNQHQAQRGLTLPNNGMQNRTPIPGVNGMWRDTSTPSHPANGFHTQGNHVNYQNSQPPYYQTQTPQTNIAQYSHPPFNEANAIIHDVEALVEFTKNEFSQDPFNQSIQQKLKALLDLQTILTSQQLPPQQLLAIRSQVTNLKNMAKPSTPVNGNQYGPPYYSRPPSQPPFQSSIPVNAPPQSVNQQPPQPLLSHLLSSIPQASQLQNGPTTQSNVPPSQPDLTNLASILGVAPAASAAYSDTPSAENPFIASLRASGLLPSTGTPEPPRSVSTLLKTPALAPPPSKPIETIPLTSASLKTPRPHLLATLYSSQPSQCSTCGRRFPATDAGKARKARHLDFHFRTNQRLIESTKRGVNRSWYIDEVEWVKYREVDDSEQTVDGDSSAKSKDGGASAAAEKTKKPYIKAPADAAVGNYTCPICQEKFETTWHEEAQEWVWMDAIQAGGRVYHASCHNEVAKAKTEEESKVKKLSPVLGKRKIERDDYREGSASKRESVE